jgi:hypothetical protein
MPVNQRAMPTFAESFRRWHKECITRKCGRKSAERYLELGEKYAIPLFGDVPRCRSNKRQCQIAPTQGPRLKTCAISYSRPSGWLPQGQNSRSSRKQFKTRGSVRFLRRATKAID